MGLESGILVFTYSLVFSYSFLFGNVSIALLLGAAPPDMHLQSNGQDMAPVTAQPKVNYSLISLLTQSDVADFFLFLLV